MGTGQKWPKLYDFTKLHEGTKLHEDNFARVTILHRGLLLHGYLKNKLIKKKVSNWPKVRVRGNSESNSKS